MRRFSEPRSGSAPEDATMNYRELEDLYDKFGGKFRFTVMLQKRVHKLVKGERALVKVKDPQAFIDIAVAEARAGKIWMEDGDVVSAAPAPVAPTKERSR